MSDLNLSENVRATLRASRVVASISGGKDSAAMSLALTEAGIEHDRVFLDTGWEHPTTYEYLRGELSKVIGPIHEVKPPLQMLDLIRKKGMFPSRQRRFCTQELKIFPMRLHLRTLMETEGVACVNTVGVRGQESEERAKLREWEYEETYGCDVWRPLLSWTEADVIETHRRHGLKPNPLYLQGATRVGCWPCINSRKSEVRLLGEIDPARVAQLAELEQEVEAKARERYERDKAAWLRSPDPEPATGTPAHARWRQKRRRLESPFSPPTFFQARNPEPDGTYPCWPIERVVDWSRTSRGGNQYNWAFGDAEPCVRWGLCDVRSDE